MTKYQVRFVYYKYNDGSADNGYYTYRKNFNSLEEAKKYIPQISYKTGWLWEECHINGYAERFDGIYKITEELVK